MTAWQTMSDVASTLSPAQGLCRDCCYTSYTPFLNASFSLWHKALDHWFSAGHAYAAVISACASGGDWQKAEGLFREMTHRGIQADVVSCTALITALAAAGQWEKASERVDWMQKQSMSPLIRFPFWKLLVLGYTIWLSGNLWGLFSTCTPWGLFSCTWWLWSRQCALILLSIWVCSCTVS